MTVCLSLSTADALKPIRTTIGLSDAEKLQIVEYHNNIRKQRYSSDMRYMTWDGELAWIAESYGLRCRFRRNKVKIHSKFTRFGQNMFAVTHSKSFSVSHAIEAWYNEMQSFQFRINTCRKGKSCANYTQMVWARTYKVGCAITHCQFISDIAIRNGLLFICNYAPSGNLLDDDGKPKTPYERGHACTVCEEGDYCRNKLCANAQRDLILPPNDSSNSGSSLAVYHAIIAVLSVLVVCLLSFILLYHFRESLHCNFLQSILNRSSSSDEKEEVSESEGPDVDDASKSAAPLLNVKQDDAEQDGGDQTEYSLPLDAIQEESTATTTQSVVSESSATTTQSVTDHAETKTDKEKALKKRPSRISLPRPAHPAPRSPPPLFPAPVLDKFR